MDNYNQNDPIKPIEFVDNYKERAISFFEKDINTDTNFAILKTTANGKYVRGNLLFYSMNGVEVYTDINNIIFVDTINKTLFVREHSKVINEISPENPEEKQYIILYTDLGFEDGDNEFPLRWEAVQGRTNAYNNIKANAAVIDIDKSIVVVENLPIKDCLSIRQFVQYIKNADMVDKDDDFDIDTYTGTEYI